MPINVLMPALSPTMEKGNLVKWLKKEGESVRAGDILAEIETDKATMEIEAVEEGVLARILVPAGANDILVNAPIAVIASEGEDPASVSPDAAGPSSPSSPPSAGAAPAAEDAASKPASSGAAAQSPVADRRGRVFSSPLARRLAREAGFDLADIAGSGPHGRVVERDIRAAIAAGFKKPPSKPALAPKPAGVMPASASSEPASAAQKAQNMSPPMSDETIKKFFAPGSYEEIPHDGMRKTIARRLIEAKQTIPHFYLSVDCELTALLKLRGEINAAAPSSGEKGAPAYKISVNDFIIKALAVALKAVPDANVTWTETAMLRHQNVDVGVAVSIPGGLITPVIRNADAKTLSKISNEMKDLSARAKLRKLKPEEYQGGSSAVSNLGMFGIKTFSAIINPPHATILAVGAGEERVIARDGALLAATMMSVTLSTDHRAVDGALGAQLLAAFKHAIENPISMIV